MVTELDAQNFDQEVLRSDGVVLVDFWAPWCGPCKMLGPIIEDIAQQFKGNGKLKVYKLNVDDNAEIAQKYGIISIPVLKFFKNGEVAAELVGLQPKEAIVSQLSSLIAG